MSTTVIVGTSKGGFVLRGDAARKNWAIEGPLFKGWKVTAVARTWQGRWLMGTASDVYGPAIHGSHDLKNWKQVATSPAYPEGGARKLTQIWKIVPHNGVCYAGVAEAGLFRSEDEGETWQPIPGLNEHRTREAWIPGAGGLCAHSILIDPKNPNRLWVGISAVGVFRSDDGGKTWIAKNQGVPIIIEDKSFCDIGFCVHGLAADSKNADVIYRQDHKGMFRTSDGGENWERNENGLPSGFGFPIAYGQGNGAIYAVPLESDEYRLPKEGKLRVYRSTDGGTSWDAMMKGLPQQNAYAGVLRGSLTTDSNTATGVYFGTTSGDVYASNDGGESWTPLPYRLPRVECVAAFTE